jgi:outer membrane protein assembly factor BamB
VAGSGHPIGGPPYDLYAYRLSDGKLAWKQPIRSSPGRTALARGGRVFSAGHHVEAFEAASGQPLWRFTPEAGAPGDYFGNTTGGVDDAHVYVGTHETGNIYALQAASGAVAWKKAFREPGWMGVWIRSFTKAGDTLFVTMERHFRQDPYLSTAIIAALDADTGQEYWRFEQGDGSDPRKIGSLTVHGNLLLYSDSHMDGYVAVDRTTRAVLWRVAQTPGYLGSRQAPEVVNGIAYGSQGDEHVYAIDVATGTLLWKRKPDMGSSFDHAVCGSLLLVDNRALMVLDLATGRRRAILHDPRDEAGEWVYTLDVQDGRAYVSTAHGTYAYECPR